MSKSYFYIVIDDDKINNLVCESVIRKVQENNHVVSFLRAEEALNYLSNTNNNHPDVIFLDINMPEMDGWEFLERFLPIRKSNTYIFMLSSSINQADFDKAKKYAEVLDYVVKPFSKEKLMKAIEMLP
jgi:two-component SAPR family response regulator